MQRAFTYAIQLNEAEILLSLEISKLEMVPLAARRGSHPMTIMVWIT